MKRSKTVVSFRRAKLVCFWYWRVRSSSSIKSIKVGTRVTLSFLAVTKFTGRLHKILKWILLKYKVIIKDQKLKSLHKVFRHSNVKRYKSAPKRYVDIKGSDRLVLEYLRQAIAGKSAIESSFLDEILMAWISNGKSGDSMNCSHSFDFSPWCLEKRFPTIERWKAKNNFKTALRLLHT